MAMVEVMNCVACRFTTIGNDLSLLEIVEGSILFPMEIVFVEQNLVMLKVAK